MAGQSKGSIKRRRAGKGRAEQNARTQRNVAWAITGGLVLGAVTVTAVAIGN